MAVDEEAPAPEHLLVGDVGAELLLVARHDLRVDVVDAGAVRHLVFEPSLVLVVLERGDLVVPEHNAPVTLAEEYGPVAAPGDDMVGGGPDVKDEDEVVLPPRVGYGNLHGPYDGHGLAACEWGMSEVLYVAGAAPPEPGDLAVVLDADD